MIKLAEQCLPILFSLFYTITLYASLSNASWQGNIGFVWLKRQSNNSCLLFHTHTHTHHHHHLMHSDVIRDRTKSSIGSDSAPPGDPRAVDFFIFFPPDEGSQNNAKFSLDSCLLGCLCDSGELTPETLSSKEYLASFSSVGSPPLNTYHCHLLLLLGVCEL